MKDKYIYSGKASIVENAGGVSGVLIKLFSGGFVLRVYDENHDFTDYDINHNDLPIIIDSDALASFYTNGDGQILDHSPEVLGLNKAKS